MTGGRESCTCFMCGGGITPGVRWVLLNRICVGSGANRCMAEFTVDDQYLWHMALDGDASEELASGPVLHLDGCLALFLEGKVVQADLGARE